MAGAKEVVGCITSAVTGVAVDMAVSKLLDNLNTQTPITEKLQRLEMLLIKIYSAVEAAEKHNIENTSLLQWRDKLKEAASAGDEVLARFRQRAVDVTSNADKQQQGGESSSSSSATAVNTGGPSFTRKALSGIVQGIRSASKMFSSNEDLKMLSKAVENLEQLSPDIGEFVSLLQLEVSSKAGKRPTQNKEKISIKKKSFKRVATSTGSRSSQSIPRLSLALLDDDITCMVASETREAMKTLMVLALEEQRRELFVSKLKKALTEISKSVEQADSRDLKDREWLASWVDILRDAKKQGYAVLEAINAGTVVINAKAGQESTLHFDKENAELTILLRSIESLVSETIDFDVLVCLCPPC